MFRRVRAGRIRIYQVEGVAWRGVTRVITRKTKIGYSRYAMLHHLYIEDLKPILSAHGVSDLTYSPMDGKKNIYCKKRLAITLRSIVKSQVRSGQGRVGQGWAARGCNGFISFTRISQLQRNKPHYKSPGPDRARPCCALQPRGREEQKQPHDRATRRDRPGGYVP